MPAQFESANSPIVREPTMMNGNTTPYNVNDEIVISGFSGNFISTFRLYFITGL